MVIFIIFEGSKGSLILIVMFIHLMVVNLNISLLWMMLIGIQFLLLMPGNLTHSCSSAPPPGVQTKPRTNETILDRNGQAYCLFMLPCLILVNITIHIFGFQCLSSCCIACSWVDCGGGSCNKTSPLTYKCDCLDGYYNLLNITAFPCYKDCKPRSYPISWWRNYFFFFPLITS